MALGLKYLKRELIHSIHGPLLTDFIDIIGDMEKSTDIGNYDITILLKYV